MNAITAAIVIVSHNEDDVLESQELAKKLMQFINDHTSFSAQTVRDADKVNYEPVE